MEKLQSWQIFNTIRVWLEEKIQLKVKKANNKILIAFIILFLAVYIIRLFDKNNTVVDINFKDSLIYKLLYIVN